ncbi:hypothetical protein CLH39_08605 [Alcaligenes faecalis]|uniref:type II toxin-antitoxin system antitoxin SocA domain-containing protein n=1 Tax=Alcaligenes TaxID=507 RepID=UPI001932B442|nr:type II toxin-antitoxin system antitoxin SocA domain-containing protein [Alcaligenes faecalis]QRF90283.1 hypothetical protein CLH39_08605 [Alcaligenes faecalis]
MDKFSRNRVINAVLYFASNIEACEKIKLFKLLFLLDFEHFRETGKSVTGYEYQAWSFGPVPTSLMEEFECPQPDLGALVQIVPVKVHGSFYRNEVRPVEDAEFDDIDFTTRQLKLMSSLVTKFRTVSSSFTMVDVIPRDNDAWFKAWNEGGPQVVIPYELALPDKMPVEDRESVLRVARNERMYENAVSLLRSEPIH